jgi:D-proline reductase (dithiol) PrdB
VDPAGEALSACRLALVSSAGLILPGQQRFDDRVRGGDFTFREIPADADARVLIDSHRSHAFDHGGMAADPNVAFPLDRARELSASHRVGSFAEPRLRRRGFSSTTGSTSLSSCRYDPPAIRP